MGKGRNVFLVGLSLIILPCAKSRVNGSHSALERRRRRSEPATIGVFPLQVPDEELFRPDPLSHFQWCVWLMRDQIGCAAFVDSKFNRPTQILSA